MATASHESFTLPLVKLRLAVHPGRLVAGFAVVMLLVIWVAIAYEVVKDRADARNEWTHNLANLTGSYDEHTSRILNSIDQDLKYVRSQYVKHGTVDFAEMSRESAIDLKAYNHIGISTPDGHYALMSEPFKGVSIADRDYFLVHRKTTQDVPFLGIPVLSRLTNQWTLPFSRRITLPDGRFGGVVTATLRPEYLSNMYKDADLGTQGLVALVGEDGIIRARRLAGVTRLGDDISAAPYFHEYKNALEGSVIFTSLVDHVPRLYTFRRLPQYQLFVVIGISVDHVYKRSNERRDGYLLIGVIASVLVLVFTQMVRRLIDDLSAKRVEAESANRMKSEFLASMSHELRTPLNGIMGFADIMRRKGTGERDRRNGEVIHASGKHLLSLVNAILDLAKIEAGRMEVYLREEELEPLVRTTVQIHEVSAATKGLSLRTTYAPGLPARIRCDTTLLRQVMNNLINNAIKFTEAGAITVRVEFAAEAPGFLRFSVQDTGIGIPAEAAELIFQKFTQVDQSMTRSHQGTGLGLSLAKQLVELMGGRIGLKSQLGEGTTICFTLPIADLPRAQEAALPLDESAIA